MAPLDYSSPKKKVLLLYLILLLFFTSSFISSANQNPPKISRILLDLEDDDPDNSSSNQPIIVKKKKPATSSIATEASSTKNKTKLVKPAATPSKNQTKVIKSTVNGELKNQTKPSDSSSKNKTKPSSSDSATTTTIKTPLKKLNSTSKKTSSNSTNTKKSSDLPSITKPAKKPQLEKIIAAEKTLKKIDFDDDEDDDLVSEFRGLPSKFQESIVPDLEKISKTSQIYLNKYNKEFAKGFKPYVGNKYAATIASFASFATVILPLIAVSLIFSRIKAYFSLQKLLIFVQIYLAIYFTILCLSSLATGLEPLRFFYATSQSTYVCVQVLQTLAYVLYLLLLLMYLILVFSTETGPTTKVLGLGQTFVGFAVGLHYYMTVFHRAVLRQPPKSSWKVHGLYATCFLVICLLGRVDRRKKAYLVEGVEEGKKS
ncbi:hypothetical protein ABFS82_12G011400 [Erythranthe guttata]|uniref:Uncharacterized protein n=1 Tax=Erythranthe guttata TaxID=4155 RepID=A0A022Q8U3_ERYGU|nr:PREDICTED: uncharacterized protein LOC105973078 [Erythranthe guttata]EYU23999.1 hypothetical protein MIMGU_mgv1a006883mg [Erythranthe guttata]|eukprot:XP_012853538.1 PREDICTED: uncharacterized protein LOC105973078 [Erythranthe guttata]